MSQPHNKDNNIGTKMEREILEILRELSQRTASLETLMSTQVEHLRESIHNNTQDLDALDRYIQQMRTDFNHDVETLQSDINKLEDLLKDDIRKVEDIMDEKVGEVKERVGEYEKKQVKVIAVSSGVMIGIGAVFTLLFNATKIISWISSF